MRVLLIHQIFTTHDSPGGTRHYELAKNSAQEGIKFTIVGSNLNYPTGKPIENLSLDAKASVNGAIEVVHAYTYPSLHKSFVWRVVSFVSFMVTSLVAGMQAKNIDLVMGTTPPLFQSISAWLISALRRKPFLLEIRDLWPEFAIELGVLKNPVLIQLSRWVESFLYARADHILVNSPAFQDYLLGKGIPIEKISVITNGVEPEMFDPNADGAVIRDKWNLANKFVATYAGAMGMANDLSTLLHAAKLLVDESDIHFLLVGDGKERSALEALKKELVLNNVTFTGAVNKSHMKEVLAASDACIATLKDIPMFRTAFPNKVFDYMAAGRPTILGNDGVFRKVLEDSNAGIYVQPESPSDLAQAVLRLSKDRDLAREMGKNARTVVVANFNRHTQALAFTKLLFKMASARI